MIFNGSGYDYSHGFGSCMNFFLVFLNIHFTFVSSSYRIRLKRRIRLISIGINGSRSLNYQLANDDKKLIYFRVRCFGGLDPFPSVQWVRIQAGQNSPRKKGKGRTFMVKEFSLWLKASPRA
jgi:hypothetical protein